MIAAFRILATGLLLAFVYSILSYALRPLPDIDMLDAIGLGFALSLAVLMWTTIFNLIVAAFAFIAAILLLFAPLAIGLKALVPATLAPPKRVSQRDIIDRLYPIPGPAQSFKVILHEQT